MTQAPAEHHYRCSLPGLAGFEGQHHLGSGYHTALLNTQNCVYRLGLEMSMGTSAKSHRIHVWTRMRHPPCQKSSPLVASLIAPFFFFSGYLQKDISGLEIANLSGHRLDR